MVILKARTLSFVVLVLIANLSCVDDHFNKGVCDWSCAVENAKATGEALRNAIGEGRLLKLTIMYKKRVDSARCANETKLETIIPYTTATVLKPSIDYQTNVTKGIMAFITQSILEVILSGQLFTKSFIEMKVSCIFELNSAVKTLSTHANYQRFTPLHSPRSILYYVQNLSASYTKNNYTLILMKLDQQTRISLVTAGVNKSSHASGKEIELLTFSKGWSVIVGIIWIISALYSPSILLLFRPSKVKQPKIHIPSLTTPAQGGAEENRGNLDSDNHPSSVAETVSLGEIDTENGEQRTTEAPNLGICEEITIPPDLDSELVSSRREGLHRPFLQTNGTPPDPRTYAHDDYDSHNGITVCDKQAIRNFICDGISTVTEFPSSAELTFPNEGSKGRNPPRQQGPLSTLNEAFETEDSHVITIEDVDPSGVDVPQIVPTRVVESGEQNLTRQPGQSSTLDEIPEIEDSHVIIVGDSNPLGVGSFIGNSLFSSLNVSKKLKALRLSIIFILPFCFIGLGELSLIMLPSFPIRISVGLPSPFLFDSVFHSTIKYPALLFLVILSALCYFIRLFSVCYLFSKNSEQTAVSCSLHSKHFICVMYEGLQSLLSKLPKSLCNPSVPCRSRHRICIAYDAVCQLWLRVINFLSPVYESYNENARECFEYCDVPQNVLLTLEKQVSVTAGYWNAFVERCTGSDETNRCISFMKMLFSPLAIIPYVLDIIVSSPLVYLCPEHQWILREQFKNKFKCSYTICSLFDIVISVFSLVWLIFSWGIYSTVPLGVLIVGIIKTLASNPIALLSEVIIVIFSVHYLWSCYGAFTKFYYDLVYKLGSSYQKKYDELKEQPGENVVLVNYKQGEEGHSIKVIPEKLFKNVCKDRNLLISKQVVCLLLKLFSTIILISFVWPIISREAVMAKISPVGELSIVISFFAVAYPLINNYINGEKLNVSEEDVNNFVKDYIEEVRGSG